MVSLSLAVLAFVPICATESAKPLRFEFQEHSGEGQFDLYRVEVDLSGQKGRFFYVGEISGAGMEGMLYEFRDFTPEPGESYRSVNPIRVSVAPIRPEKACGAREGETRPLPALPLSGWTGFPVPSDLYDRGLSSGAYGTGNGQL
jgi:hypothetical protein